MHENAGQQVNVADNEVGEQEQRTKIITEIENLTPRVASQMLLRLRGDHLMLTGVPNSPAIDWVEQLLGLQVVKGEWLENGRLIT